MEKKKRNLGITSKGRKSKSILRTASKSMEKQIVDASIRIYDNPLIVLPEYHDSVSKKKFRKISSQLSKINKFKDNQKKLESFAKKRSLAGAVAGTLLIFHSKKVPFLAAAEYSSDSVMYAQRGNAPREYLIAAQHHDDPFFRLFGIRDIALKHGLHIYSWNNGFNSTGLESLPSKEFISFICLTLDYSLQKNAVLCPHVTSEMLLEKNSSKTPYLQIFWKSANITFGICEHCASKKRNLIFSITKYLIEPDVRDDFDVAVFGEVIKDRKEPYKYETTSLEDFYSGKITDYDMIKQNMSKRMEKLQNSETIQYVLNGNSYGNQADAFIEALYPNDFERHALQFFLKQSSSSVVVTNATVNSVIEIFWKEFGKSFLQSILNDEVTIEKLLSLNETPSIIINTAFQLSKRRFILQHLPSYKGLPDIAQFADTLARLYRTDGIEKMIATIKQRPNTPQGKAMAYAFLQTVGKAEDKKWMFSKVEIESGEFLRPFVERLLKEEPERYHMVFQELLAASGSLTSLDEYKVE